MNTVYKIYKRCDNLSWIKKILYICILGGIPENNIFVGYTTNKSTAESYMKVNDNSLYMEETIMSVIDFNKFEKVFKNLKIRFYTDKNDNYIFIQEKDKKKLIKKGVCIYDRVE